MRIFVAGATGAVGSEVVRLAKERGHYLHTLSRSPAKALKLAGIADRIDVLDASVEVPNLLGIDIVVSCLGAPVSLFSPDRRGYRAVDLQANSNLLRAAKTAGIQRFLYVAAHVGPAYSRTAYIRAHEDFVNVLHSSGLSSSVVRPTGIFAAFDDLLTLARRGLTTVIGDGRARTNPIHQADVAAQVLALLDFGPGEISIGGPEIWSRREIAELPFRALGRPPRILSIPAFAFRAGGKMMGGGQPPPWPTLPIFRRCQHDGLRGPGRRPPPLTGSLPKSGRGQPALTAIRASKPANHLRLAGGTIPFIRAYTTACP